MKIVDIIKNIDNPFIIIDFDHTITTTDSDTSYNVYTKVMNDEYKNKYNILERKSNSKLKIITKIFWYKKYRLLKKYINNSYIHDTLKYIHLRESILPLFEYARKNNIKVLLCSAGSKDTIKEFLKEYNINYDYLLANDTNTSYNGLITPYNKNIMVSKTIKKENIKNKTFILIGDRVEDMNILDSNKVSILISDDKKLISKCDYLI